MFVVWKGTFVGKCRNGAGVGLFLADTAVRRRMVPLGTYKMQSWLFLPLTTTPSTKNQVVLEIVFPKKVKNGTLNRYGGISRLNGGQLRIGPHLGSQQYNSNI